MYCAVCRPARGVLQEATYIYGGKSLCDLCFWEALDEEIEKESKKEKEANGSPE